MHTVFTMKKSAIAILSSKSSWFIPYSQLLVKTLVKMNHRAKLFSDPETIGSQYDIVFILSYFRIIPAHFLLSHKHNLVVHESALPNGRGWAPLFWQILEGKNIIPITLFEATENADEGAIILQDHITLEGHELYEEIRAKQAHATLDLCLRFLEQYPDLTPVRQKGKPTHYPKRSPSDSEINPNESIVRQFNLMRIASNAEFPLFFFHQGHKYILQISKESKVNHGV